MEEMRNETICGNECLDFLKFPCWRAAPAVLRDAQ
ncbi:hypothetical protein A2U01_0090041, partial [Trifolium medium]|nr:hypothetical protein [Trifolium medium]